MIHEIKARRSTRRFIKKNIPEEDLHALLEAASWAPSEHNEQPWRFVVVRGDARKEVVRALKEGIKRNRSDKAAIFGKGYEKYIPAAIYTRTGTGAGHRLLYQQQGEGLLRRISHRRASDGNGGHPVGERGDPEYVPGSDGEEYRDAVDLQYFLCL